MNTSAHGQRRLWRRALAIVAVGVALTGCRLGNDPPLRSTPFDFRDVDTLAWSFRISSDAIRSVECTRIGRLTYRCRATDEGGRRRTIRVGVDPSGTSWTAR
jgi:hypothetical protein